MEMSLAYAASQSGEHGGEPNVGDVILHHVLDTKILSMKILGLDLSITKHVSLNLSGFVAGRSGPSTGQNRPFWLCSRWQGPTRHTRSSRPAQTASADKSW